MTTDTDDLYHIAALLDIVDRTRQRPELSHILTQTMKELYDINQSLAPPPVEPEPTIIEPESSDPEPPPEEEPVTNPVVTDGDRRV